MEQDILLWCVITPPTAAIIAIAASYLCHRMWAGGDKNPPLGGAVLTITGWVTGVGVALWERQELTSWWPTDAWQRTLYPIAVTSFALALVIKDGNWSNRWRWLIACVGSGATALVAMPQGETWSDLLPVMPTWMFAVTVSSFVNLWMLDSMTRRADQQSNPRRWVCWIAAAGLGGPLMLAVSAYGGLAEWVVAAMAATSAFAVVASLTERQSWWCAACPAVMLAASATASGRFYTYEDHPAWLYAIVLLTPAIISAAEFPVRHRSAFIRVTTALLAAIVLLAVIGWKLSVTSSDDEWAQQQDLNSSSWCETCSTELRTVTRPRHGSAASVASGVG